MKLPKYIANSKRKSLNNHINGISKNKLRYNLNKQTPSKNINENINRKTELKEVINYRTPFSQVESDLKIKNRENNNIISNLNTFSNIKILLFNMIFLLDLFALVGAKKSEIYEVRNLDATNDITIKILGGGTQDILSYDFWDDPPDLILLNGVEVSFVSDYQISNLNSGENIIKMSWNSKLSDCEFMFYELTNLIEVDLSEFDSSEVTTMSDMFNGCNNLKTINFENFDTSKVKKMSYLFASCSSLTSLNMSNFKTPSLINMVNMFFKCESLLTLDLTNFDTSNVQDMRNLFNSCSSLTSLNISNFNTSLTQKMGSMFENCILLISLDLSSFNTTKCTDMASMFYNCSELLSLDLSNFKTSSVIYMTNFLAECKKLKYLDISNFDAQNARYMAKMFFNCINLEYINLKNFKEGTDKNEINDMFSGVPNSIIYCINNEEESPIIIDGLNKSKCIVNDCSDNWKVKQKIYISEKNICVNNCSEDETYFYTYKNKCYNECPEGTLLSNENDNLCLISCPENMPYEKNEECFSNCTSEEFLTQICTINNQNLISKEHIINGISQDISNDELNSLLLNVLNGEKEDLLIKDKNETYLITSTFNQINNNYSEETKIDLKDCENVLKDQYAIINDEALIIYKIDYFIEEFLIPITEYEVFHPETKAKLNLNYCLDKKIDIFIPVLIDEESIYKYDPNSDYYKDRCYPSECVSEEEFEKRINDFNNYLSLCESNCTFNGYDTNTKIVTCECTIKSQFSTLSEILNKKNSSLYQITEIYQKTESTNINSDEFTDISNNTNDISTDSEQISISNTIYINQDTNSNINSDLWNMISTDSEQISISNTIYINQDTNSNINSDLNSNFNTNSEENSNDIANINQNTDSDFNNNLPITNSEYCNFMEKGGNNCKESITFEDLIKQNYYPLKNQNSITKVFEMFSEELNSNNLDINQDEIIEGQNVTFQSTTSERQNYYIKNNLFSNISSIDLFECEETLKKELQIEDPLIIVKVDIKRNDTTSTQVEYEVFNPYNFNKLNLSICDGKRIIIYPPLILDEDTYNLAIHLDEQGYDLFDSFDDFYNDICSPYNSFNNTDVTLNDRKNDFYLENITLCESTCQYEEINLENLKVKCQCNVKTEIKSESQVKFTPNIIVQNFYKIENYANIRAAICYKLVFNLNKLKNNYGSYILIALIILFLIIMIINFITMNNIISKFIQILLNEYLNKIEHMKVKEKNNIINNNKNKKRTSKMLKIKNENNHFNNIKGKIQKIKKTKETNCPRKRKLKMKKNKNDNVINSKVNLCSEKIKNRKNNKKKSRAKSLASININYSIYCKQLNFNKEQKDDSQNIIDKIIIFTPKDERAKFFTDDELNSLSYEYALKIDFRTYFQFYFSLIKQTHLIIFTFFVKNDYNILLLKLSLFIISFSLFFSMNTLFFRDDSIHKIYEDEGKYEFLYQIPQMLYSTILSQIISSLLEKLSLSQDDILNLKEKRNKKEIKNIINKIIKCIKIKCFIFFIIGIILLFGFWYYVSAFCAVYYNTQIPLIKDCLFSFLISMIYPFLLDLLPGIFRILALRREIKCLYGFSKIIAKIIGIL